MKRNLYKTNVVNLKKQKETVVKTSHFTLERRGLKLLVSELTFGLLLFIRERNTWKLKILERRKERDIFQYRKF